MAQPLGICVSISGDLRTDYADAVPANQAALSSIERNKVEDSELDEIKPQDVQNSCASPSIARTMTAQANRRR
jgi:hypothetical protein